MNKICPIISITAAMLTVASFADVTPYADTVKTDTDWYTVAATDVDTDLDSSPVSIGSDTMKADTIPMVFTFTITAPNACESTSDLPTGNLGPIGIAQVVNDGFYVKVGEGAWTKITGLDNVAENTQFTLKLTLDNRDTTKKFRWSVNDKSAAFAEYTKSGTGFCFDCYGKANIALTAIYQTITIENIVIEGGKIAIPEADIQKIEEIAQTGSETASEYLNANAHTKFSTIKNENIKVSDAYALGLVKPVNNEMQVQGGGELIVKKAENKTVAQPTKIPVALNVEPPANVATITYQIIGSTDGTSWTAIGESTTDADALAIPVDQMGEYKLFKVRANIEYLQGNN